MNFQNILSAVSPSYELAKTHVKRHPILSVSAVGVVSLIPFVVHSYHGFLALGRGGPSPNLKGWAWATMLKLIARYDTISNVAEYDNPKAKSIYGPRGTKSFLGDAPLPLRQGNRPTVPGYVAPQRQITDKLDEAGVLRLNKVLYKIEDLNSSFFAMLGSGLESAEYKALWVKPGPAPLPRYMANNTKGEIAHVHPDGSGHIILSLVDAATAIRQGWAEQHKLSGIYELLPLSYVFVYAPRNEEEFKIWKRLVNAAIEFNAEGHDVKLDI